MASPNLTPMTRTLAFIQARLSSSRFPGKVLAPLQGQPLIVYMVERVRQARLLDGVVVVTSTDASDDVLATTLAQAHIPVFRGDLQDVLKRFADAARRARPPKLSGSPATAHSSIPRSLTR